MPSSFAHQAAIEAVLAILKQQGANRRALRKERSRLEASNPRAVTAELEELRARSMAGGRPIGPTAEAV